MPKTADNNVGARAAACPCPLCQSPFISGGRPHDPTPCREPISRKRLPREDVQDRGPLAVLEGARAC